MIYIITRLSHRRQTTDVIADLTGDYMEVGACTFPELWRYGIVLDFIVGRMADIYFYWYVAAACSISCLNRNNIFAFSLNNSSLGHDQVWLRP